MGAVLALSAIGDEKSYLFLKTATGDENQYVQKIAQSVTSKKERIKV
jgi:HEAT repeat protein